MERNEARSALGRGLSSLISSPPVSLSLAARSEPQGTEPAELATNEAKPGEPTIRFIDINLIGANPTQPRQHFEDSELNELANSIRTSGVLQPILVRPSKEDSTRFEIVAGERRWRAAKIAAILKIPALVKIIDDRETLEIALVENVQRSNLNPIEEAIAYQRLIDEFSLTQLEIAERVGKDRASIANYLRLLRLPKDVLQNIKGGQLSVGHAKAILSIKDTMAQSSLAKKAIGESLSVRALEGLVSRVVVLDAGRVAANKDMQGNKLTKANSFPEIVDKLRNAMGTKVVIKHHPSGRGRIEIDYFSEQELDRVVDKICN